MTLPVTYVEFNSPNLTVTREFFASAFGWQMQPFVDNDYLVAAHGDGPGVDTGMMTSRDFLPRTVAVIGVADLDKTLVRVRESGGTVVVEPFAIAGVGRGAYFVDPTGLLVGVHEANPDAR